MIWIVIWIVIWMADWEVGLGALIGRVELDGLLGGLIGMAYWDGDCDG